MKKHKLITIILLIILSISNVKADVDNIYTENTKTELRLFQVVFTASLGMSIYTIGDGVNINNMPEIIIGFAGAIFSGMALNMLYLDLQKQEVGLKVKF